MPELTAGLQHRETLVVDARLTVPAVAEVFTGFADMPRVFATAFLVGFVEWTCIEALRPFLGPDRRTVGTHINVSHIAATPVGMKVTAAVELIMVEGRELRFEVACRDEAGPIGSGFHNRTIIDFEKFSARVAAKAAAAPYMPWPASGRGT